MMKIDLIDELTSCAVKKPKILCIKENKGPIAALCAKWNGGAFAGMNCRHKKTQTFSRSKHNSF